MNLYGLDPETFTRLILSVGTRRGLRPLSPIEVFEAFQTMVKNGADQASCAAAVHLEGPDMVGRFLRLRELAPELHHLVTWGETPGKISFSSAQQLSRLPSTSQIEIADRVISSHLNSKELAQVNQLVARTKQAPLKCVDDVIRMRPSLEVRSVVVGAISDPDIQRFLRGITQSERDRKLETILHSLLGPEISFSASLSPERFTISGDHVFHRAFQHLGDSFETKISERLY